ncbi:anti-sigma factor [Leifsonia naganoensis]|uniref:Anti-sigma-K factor RskA n=1 Tax=Leifsonia naganoensis TaxID=150025 RepID=A0A853DTW8_9MICO|nr:anti-sigma factor [Leifsonia naganoensis]NYK10899.1 anti-sigma-K factor RskA [Leifsonia naganoensis]
MTDETRPTPARLGAELGAENEQEARDFEDVAAQLGLAAEPVTPRPELKAALFAAIQTTPQLPAEPEAAPAPVLTPVPAPEAVQAAPTAPAAPEAPAPEATPAERTAQRRWFARPAIIAASAAAAVILFFGGTIVGGTIAGNDSTQQQASALAQINAAPDAQRASAAVTGGGTATLVWSAQLGTSALIANDLPNLPNDKTYELWYIRDGKATSAGTMDAAGAGSTWKVLAGTMKAGDTVGVTVEPSGGSPQPTTNPIVAIPS